MADHHLLNNGLGDLVTYNPISISAEISELDALEKMQTVGINHLPVVDSEKQVIGIISSADLQRHQKTLNGATDSAKILNASQLMSTSVVVVEQQNSPLLALKMMLKGGYHSLPVVEHGRLLGIISSTDYLREYSYGELPPQQDLVSQHLVHRFASISHDEGPQVALEQMQTAKLSYLAVVAGNLPVGIVSKKKLVRLLKSEQGQNPTGDQSKLPVYDTPVIRPADLLSRAASTMIENSCKSLVVSDRSNQFRGLLTEDHIMQAIATSLQG